MKYSTKTILITLAAVIIVLGLAFGVVYFLKHNQTADKTTDTTSKSQLAQQAGDAETKANDAAQKGDYTGATTLYNQAKSLYQKAGDTPRSNSVDAQLNLIEHQKKQATPPQTPPSLAPGGN